jgi:hypothetical protein
MQERVRVSLTVVDVGAISSGSYGNKIWIGFTVGTARPVDECIGIAVCGRGVVRVRKKRIDLRLRQRCNRLSFGSGIGGYEERN